MVKRVFLIGSNVAHVERHVAYALELGAEVLFAGVATLYPAAPPAGYHFLPLAQFTDRTWREGEYAELFQQECEKLAAAYAEFQPDLCHMIGLGPNYEMALAAQLRPLVLTVFGYLEHWVYSAPRFTEQDAHLLGVDGILVEPPMMVELCRGLLPPSVRVEEFTIGLDGRIFQPAIPAMRAAWRRALQLPPEATVILSPRGWSARYNHHKILAAFAQALPQLPAPSYLLFVKMRRTWQSETFDTLREQVQQQAQRLGVADHVRFLPHFPMSTIATLYNVADLIVSYCYPDAFPSSVLEAMACERPVIAPDLPTFAGSVIAEHAHLVPPRDVAALGAAMVELTQQPPAAERLAAARQAILAHYDKPVVMAQLASLYDSFTARNPLDNHIPTTTFQQQ